MANICYTDHNRLSTNSEKNFLVQSLYSLQTGLLTSSDKLIKYQQSKGLKQYCKKCPKIITKAFPSSCYIPWSEKNLVNL